MNIENLIIRFVMFLGVMISSLPFESVSNAQEVVANLINSSTGGSSGAASLDLPRPNNVQNNDILVAFVYVEVNNSATFTPPSGWSQMIRQGMTLGSTPFQWISYCKKASNEPSSWTWGWSGGNVWNSGIVLAYRPTSTTGQLHCTSINTINGSVATSAGTTLTATSITTTVPNARIVAAYTTFECISTFAPTTGQGMTQVLHSGTGGCFNHMISHGEQVSAGATGNKTVTTGGISTLWTAQMLAIAPGLPPTPTQFNLSTDLLAWNYTVPTGGNLTSFVVGCGTSTNAYTIFKTENNPSLRQTSMFGSISPGTYYCAIRADNIAGSSSYSDEVYFQFNSGSGGGDTTPPAAPSGLTVGSLFNFDIINR